MSRDELLEILRDMSVGLGLAVLVLILLTALAGVVLGILEILQCWD